MPALPNPMPNPFMFNEEERFALDPDAFLSAIEPAPAFIETPRPEFLRATEIMPILETLSSFLKPRMFAAD